MFNVSLATLMQHLLFLFLLVVPPIWDLHDTRKLKRNPSSEQIMAALKSFSHFFPATWPSEAFPIKASDNPGTTP
jgi:hypothetical protein